ncbi:MAG: ATP-binding protein [Elusimicrobiota bacterium]
MMIKRLLSLDLSRAVAEFPVTALIGPRQVGKTTLAKEFAKSRAKSRRESLYLDLELSSDMARLSDAEMYLEAQADRLVVIDEVQRRPDLFPLLRALVDKERRPGRFLILGSANLLALRQISESLAGRIQFLELGPFSRTETGPKVPLRRHWLRGGYPDALAPRSDEASARWREALIRSYLERDLNQLGFRVAAPELRRFWTMLAHNHGQSWNAHELASSFGVTPPTATHYRSILEQMFLVRALPAWHANLKKRLVKSPRVYIRDSGILHSLLGLSSLDALLAHPVAGKSWEGFILEQILETARGRLEASYFRTHAGAEIDLVIHRGRKILALTEVKLGLKPSLSRGFHEARKDLGLPKAWVIYNGGERYPLGSGVEAIGLDQFLIDILPKL